MQHLKSKFGSGYQLKVQLQSSLTAEQESHLITCITPACPGGTSVVRQDAFCIVLQIAAEGLLLPLLFRLLADLRAKGGVFGECSVSQTNLEDVFIAKAGQSHA